MAERAAVSATRTLYEAHPRSSFWRAALHLGGLWALAFAQPLFDLLGRNAQFFIARGSTTADILALAFGYTLLPPLVGAFARVGARADPAGGRMGGDARVRRAARGGVRPAAGGGRARRLGGRDPGRAARWGPARRRCTRASPACGRSRTVLSPAPLVVLVLFLVVSPVRGLLAPSEAKAAVPGPSTSSTPIVQVVLDELPASTLVGPDGKIDAELFPNFARLARESTWYRNATTVDDLTSEAVPAQLTGEQPRVGLPADHARPPAQPVHAVRGHATAHGGRADHRPVPGTALRRRPPGARIDRLESLESDLEVVVQHLLLPEPMREGLPAIDRVWEGFEADAGEFRTGRHLKRDVLARLARYDATGRLRARDRLARPPRARARRCCSSTRPSRTRPGATCPTGASTRSRARSSRDWRARAGSGRSGRSTRASSATCCRSSTSTAWWAACSRRCARAGSTTTPWSWSPPTTARRS